MIDVNARAKNKLLTETNQVMQESVQRAFDIIKSDGELIVHSKVDEDFANARDHFSDFMSTIPSSDVAPYIAGWYIFTGSTVSAVEERMGGILLHLLDSTLKEQRRGIAFIGSSRDLFKETKEAYDFCDIWCETNKGNTKTSDSNCKQRSLRELVRLLTALFIVQYTDEYFWTIYNMPGLKDFAQQAAERCTGFTAKQFSELRKHWDTRQLLHSHS